ncbi:SnoaL-like polyketide cyclase [Clavibacter michiganensis subsp. michiganensis]|uniref:ester cyclase n=1 Tax=Clavibacter michiganensis TaxID=28447 RepID=UPI000A36CC0A|nr:ester cyclase [Clavibacter michiganensis]OUD93886.1 SnoaL-like polyketide cyclase [Clavibacter michiganensis subsp. michiganensis]OUE12004.1 SnoaL-like polyketide cyclase [Clavibacter michiganensis subsp. michiganensis]
MTHDLRATMQRFLEFINSGHEAIGREVIHPDAAFMTPFSPEPLVGLDGYLQILAIMRGAISDVRWTVQQLVVEGDQVAARFELRGTHDGEFLGVPATGKSVVVGASAFYRFADGRIIDETGQPDLLALLGQIGALPPALR